MDKIVIYICIYCVLISCKSKEEQSLYNLNLKYTYNNSIRVDFNNNLIKIDYVNVRIKQSINFTTVEKNKILKAYNINRIYDFEGKEIYLYPKEEIIMPPTNNVIEINHNKLYSKITINNNVKNDTVYQQILDFQKTINFILLKNKDFKTSLIKYDSLKNNVKSLH